MPGINCFDKFTSFLQGDKMHAFLKTSICKPSLDNVPLNLFRVYNRDNIGQNRSSTSH